LIFTPTALGLGGNLAILSTNYVANIDGGDNDGVFMNKSMLLTYLPLICSKTNSFKN